MNTTPALSDLALRLAAGDSRLTTATLARRGLVTPLTAARVLVDLVSDGALASVGGHYEIARPR